MKSKKKALGRGLDAILQSPDTDITSKDISGEYVAGAIATISIENIDTNPFQPRDNQEQNSLEELAISIKKQGIIQPVTVRKLGYDKYQLISGERRLRAASIAGLTEIPAYIRVANDQQMLEMALVENIQREDLNPVDVAIGYKRLIEECHLTQEKLSEKMGKKRSTITNYLRLLRLPAEVQMAIRNEKISMGHARALITLDDPESQLYLLKKIIDKDLSVREVEKIVRDFQSIPDEKTKKPPLPLPERYAAIKEKLSERLGTGVELKRSNKGKGSIVISFNDNDELERLFQILFEKPD